MAKASGSTRNTSPRGNSIAPEQTLTPAMQDSIARLIGKGGRIDFSREQSDAWDDMTVDERVATLEQGGFTGLIDREELEYSRNIYTPLSKDELVREFQDALVNEMAFNGMDDTTTFTVGYRDGTRKYLSRDENDFGDAGITKAGGSTTDWSKAKSAMKLRDVAYIIRTDGYAEPNYWVARDGDSRRLMMNYGGFQEWQNGRAK